MCSYRTLKLKQRAQNIGMVQNNREPNSRPSNYNCRDAQTRAAIEVVEETSGASMSYLVSEENINYLYLRMKLL